MKTGVILSVEVTEFIIEKPAGRAVAIIVATPGNEVYAEATSHNQLFPRRPRETHARRKQSLFGCLERGTPVLACEPNASRRVCNRVRQSGVKIAERLKASLQPG